jgi:hypothetical protein
VCEGVLNEIVSIGGGILAGRAAGKAEVLGGGGLHSLGGYCMSLVLLDMEEYGEEYNNEYPTVELPTDIPCGETISYSPRYRLFWEKMTNRCDHIGVCRGMYSLGPSIRFRYDMGFKPTVAPEIDLRVFPFPRDYRCQGWGTHYYDVSTYHRKRKEREKALYEARWTIIELRK